MQYGLATFNKFVPRSRPTEPRPKRSKREKTLAEPKSGSRGLGSGAETGHIFLRSLLSVPIPTPPSFPFLPPTRMDRKRERHNARARQSVAGGASHKRRKRRSANGPTGGDTAGAPSEVLPDPNAEIISLKPLEQKELERRERVRQQVCTLFCVRKCSRRSISSLLSSTRWRSTVIQAIRERRRRNWRSISCVGWRVFEPL